MILNWSSIDDEYAYEDAKIEMTPDSILVPKEFYLALPASTRPFVVPYRIPALNFAHVVAKVLAMEQHVVDVLLKRSSLLASSAETDCRAWLEEV